MAANRLDEFAPVFYPRTHAVIGASSNEQKFGGRFLQVQLTYGYRGKLYPVNPQETEVLGLKTYASVAEIPGPVDFATVAVPAPAVPRVVEECLAKGIKAVQVLSAGFREVISYGNACDVNECDLLEYLYQDPEVKIISGYLEGVRDGPRFFRLLQEVCREKPVVIWKGGLTQGGARAAQSHTASLSGEEAIWNAVFTQTGAVRVGSLEELLGTILAFMHLAPQSGNKVCPITGGGGIGVAAADTCEQAGLAVPVFPKPLQEKLSKIVPAAGASARNPVDVGNPGPPAPMLKAVLETVCTEADIDIIIIDEISMALPAPGGGQVTPFGRMAEERMQVPVDIKDRFGKTMVMVMPVEAIATDMLEPEGDRRRARDYYHQHGIPVYLNLEQAGRALANFTGHYRRRDGLTSPAGD